MNREKVTPRFITAAGVKIPAVTEKQMREIDRVVIEETGPNLLQMMENAGRNLALQIIEMLGDSWKNARILVLAGAGGNGGGGICAARHLANRSANVGLVIAEPERMGTEASWQYHVYSATNGGTVSIDALPGEKPDIIVDALIGYSLHGSPRSLVRELINWINNKNIPILALDIPSGIDSSTGETPGDHVTATQTMTLALPKRGLRNPTAGEIILADIGIPHGAFLRAGIQHKNPFNEAYLLPIRRLEINSPKE